MVTALEGFRRATNALLDLSFDTICGAGPDGAIVHYRVTEATDRRCGRASCCSSIRAGSTSTAPPTSPAPSPWASPPAEHDACFTRVLQGMIAISRALSRRASPGAHRRLARYPLWLAGQDYDHGTGHGVGVYLGVHEGPQRSAASRDVPLEPGMILSNEPGYYREGAFGIRIENLIVVEEAPPLPGRRRPADAGLPHADLGADRPPADRPAAMAPDERAWLDAYHAEVRRRVAPRVDGPAADWLTRVTAPL